MRKGSKVRSPGSPPESAFMEFVLNAFILILRCDEANIFLRNEKTTVAGFSNVYDPLNKAQCTKQSVFARAHRKNTFSSRSGLENAMPRPDVTIA